MRHLVVVGFSFLFSLSALASSLEEAKTAYESGQLETATAKLEAMAEIETSGALQAALGAAWFKRGDIGRSLFHLRRASELRPRDADVRYNLSFVRKAAKDRLETASSWFSLPFSERETALAAAWLSFIAGILGSAWFTLRRGWLKRTAIAATSLAGLAAVAAAISYATHAPFGVVTAAETPVRSGPGETYTHLFTLHAGAEFDTVTTAGEWLQIHLSDGKRGWLVLKGAARLLRH